MFFLEEWVWGSVSWMDFGAAKVDKRSPEKRTGESQEERSPGEGNGGIDVVCKTAPSPDRSTQARGQSQTHRLKHEGTLCCWLSI